MMIIFYSQFLNLSMSTWIIFPVLQCMSAVTCTEMSSHMQYVLSKSFVFSALKSQLRHVLQEMFLLTECHRNALQLQRTARSLGFKTVWNVSKSQYTYGDDSVLCSSKLGRKPALALAVLCLLLPLPLLLNFVSVVCLATFAFCKFFIPFTFELYTNLPQKHSTPWTNSRLFQSLPLG